MLCILSALASLSESQGDEGNDASLHAALTVACPPTTIWAGEREVCDGEELWAQGISKLPVTQQGPKCLCLMICKFVWKMRAEGVWPQEGDSGTEILSEALLDQLSHWEKCFLLGWLCKARLNLSAVWTGTETGASVEQLPHFWSEEGLGSLVSKVPLGPKH